MPRSPLQSDFVVHHEQPPVEEIELPRIPGIDAVELPKAIVRTNDASERSTKIIMTLTWVMLAILVLMCAIGPHIPAGE